MSLWLYSLQAVLIAGTILVTVRPKFTVLGWQILVWACSVIFIAWRYGVNEQLGFYSNDQSFYSQEILRGFLSGNWPISLTWWIDQSKAPYTLAGLPLSLMGIHETLALKTVSLLALLALSNSLMIRFNTNSTPKQIQVLYVTGCGLIGMFFSTLALRETMMMYLVYQFVTSRSPAIRVGSAALLFLLRPHLAIAILTAEVLTSLWQWITEKRQSGVFEAPLLVVLGSVIGDYLYALAFQRRNLSAAPSFADWGVTEITKVASNFVGLQFLANDESKLRLTVNDLLLLRVLFSETVIIPSLMTVTFLFLAFYLSRRHQFILVAFTIYVSIATNTDFNSFRQNLPFIPVLGMVVLDAWQNVKTNRQSHALQESRSNSR